MTDVRISIPERTAMSDSTRRPGGHEVQSEPTEKQGIRELWRKRKEKTTKSASNISYFNGLGDCLAVC